MREILFRGKRLDNGEWVEGFYHYTNWYDPHTFEMVDTNYWILPIGKQDAFEVGLATVGQYTGLTDKNGKKIFEGDIVLGHCHSAWSHRLQRCVVAYGRDGFEARHHIDGLESDYYTYRVLFSKDVAAIGNIHDNPELLEEEE